MPSGATTLLTLLVGTVTLTTGRTTILQDVVHLVNFAVFPPLSAMPWAAGAWAPPGRAGRHQGRFRPPMADSPRARTRDAPTHRR